MHTISEEHSFITVDADFVGAGSSRLLNVDPSTAKKSRTAYIIMYGGLPTV
jgi:hypothetical protein